MNQTKIQTRRKTSKQKNHFALQSLKLDQSTLTKAGTGLRVLVSVSLPALLRVNMVVQLRGRTRLFGVITYISDLFGQSQSPLETSTRQPVQRDCLGRLLY